MKIVADENIANVAALFAPYGELVTLPGRSMTAEQLADAEVLLVRSVTNVNEQLLSGSNVRFVGTATIGTDHLDQQYLQQAGIHYASAPGCNAEGVVQYVLSVFAAVLPGWRAKTVGIIGCGNVGGRLYRRLTGLGVTCRCYDPFLSRDQIADLTDLESTLQSDVICLHTPLTESGPHPTYHLFNEACLRALKPGSLLINAGRGAVIDNRALLSLIEPLRLRVVLDVWENEPAIDLALVDRVELATPHIAGYSDDGKLRGSFMIRDALDQWLGHKTQEMPLTSQQINAQVNSLDEALLTSYDVREDDARLRQAMSVSAVEVAQAFDGLRKNYPQRLEYSHYRLEPGDGGEFSPELQAELNGLGFAC